MRTTRKGSRKNKNFKNRNTLKHQHGGGIDFFKILKSIPGFLGYRKNIVNDDQLQNSGFRHCCKLVQYMNPKFTSQYTDNIFSIGQIKEDDILRIWNVTQVKEKGVNTFFGGHIGIEIERNGKYYSFGFYPSALGSYFNNTVIAVQASFSMMFLSFLSMSSFQIQLQAAALAAAIELILTIISRGQIVSPDFMLNISLNNFRKVKKQEGFQPTLVGVLTLKEEHKELIRRMNSLLFPKDIVSVAQEPSPEFFLKQDLHILNYGHFNMKNIFGKNCSGFMATLMKEEFLSCRFAGIMQMPSTCKFMKGIDGSEFSNAMERDKIEISSETENVCEIAMYNDTNIKRVVKFLHSGKTGGTGRIIFKNITNDNIDSVVDIILTPISVERDLVEIVLSPTVDLTQPVEISKENLEKIITALKYTINVVSVDFADIKLESATVDLLVCSLLEKSFYSQQFGYDSKGKASYGYQKSRKTPSVTFTLKDETLTFKAPFQSSWKLLDPKQPRSGELLKIAKPTVYIKLIEEEYKKDKFYTIDFDSLRSKIVESTSKRDGIFGNLKKTILSSTGFMR